MKKPQIVRGKRRDAYWEFQENMQIFPNSRCSSLPVLGITDSSKKIKIQNEALQLTSKWLCISLAPSCHHTRQQIGEFWMFSVDHRGSIGSSNRSAPAIHDNAANTREFDWIWVIGERPLYYFHNTTYDKAGCCWHQSECPHKRKSKLQPSERHHLSWSMCWVARHSSSGK